MERRMFGAFAGAAAVFGLLSGTAPAVGLTMPEKDVVVGDATRFEIDWIRVYE